MLVIEDRAVAETVTFIWAEEAVPVAEEVGGEVSR